MKTCLNPPNLPRPAATYSQVVRAGNTVFLAGMVPFDSDGNLAGDDVRTQTRRVIENIEAGLAAVGGALSDICTVTAYLTNLERDFADFNAVYTEFFASEPPARATVGVDLIGILVEVQATAILSD